MRPVLLADTGYALGGNAFSRPVPSGSRARRGLRSQATSSLVPTPGILLGALFPHALPWGPVTVMVTSSEPGWTVSPKPSLLPMPPALLGTVAPPRFR